MGGLSALGLGLPQLLQFRQARASESGAAPTPKSCILIFLLGGAPQHSTWDPKPDAPAEVRGEFGPMETVVPGLRISELFPQTALVADKMAFLRAMSTGDNAHSSSGYYMFTGHPHAPMNAENANPGFPNNHPTLAAIARRCLPARGALPGSIRLPHHIYNTDGSVWPGQDAGFLGQSVDPWLLNCKPADPGFQIAELTLPNEVSADRLHGRQRLLSEFRSPLAEQTASSAVASFERLTTQALDVVGSASARRAFDLSQEPEPLRDRYGRGQFGQSVLLARRLIEAGVGLVQVNWYRGPEEPPDAPCWDSHARESLRLKTALSPPLDSALATLISDLDDRGRLEDTLVLCLTEFGRTPRINGNGGRDHWGSVFSVALAGAGIRGGVAYGASDAIGAYPASGRVLPQDLTATILTCLGIDPRTEIHDTVGRPLPLSTGEVIAPILA